MHCAQEAASIEEQMQCAQEAASIEEQMQCAQEAASTGEQEESATEAAPLEQQERQCARQAAHLTEEEWECARQAAHLSQEVTKTHAQEEPTTQTAQTLTDDTAAVGKPRGHTAQVQPTHEHTDVHDQEEFDMTAMSAYRRHLRSSMSSMRLGSWTRP